MEFSKSKLDNMLKNPFRKDESPHPGPKNKQLEEFQRLKSICFPKERERNSRHDRSFSNANKQDTSVDKGHSRNTSFFLERTRNLSISKDQSQSFMLNTKQNDMSFNMSPLKGKMETDADLSFDNDLNKRMPIGVLDGINQDEDAKEFATTEWATLGDCKNQVARNNYLKIVNHYSNEMIKFVTGLSETMKNVSLTKMSEKSINLMMKKYVNKLESIKDQWAYPTSKFIFSL